MMSDALMNEHCSVLEDEDDFIVTKIMLESQPKLTQDKHLSLGTYLHLTLRVSLAAWLTRGLITDH